jgi:transketolase
MEAGAARPYRRRMTGLQSLDPLRTALPSANAMKDLARQLRVDVIRSTAAAGSGHPTSGLSAADLMAVLLARHLRYDFDHPSDARNDHLIFSKGHASSLLYAVYRAAGAIDDEELLSYRKLGSRFEGHPTPRIPWVDVATGSLGLGLPVGAGIAYAGRHLDQLPYRVWVLCGDSELAEGSVWEAASFAAFHRLDNLIVMVDVNRLGQSGETMLGHDTAAYAARFGGFGWHVVEVDGHDVEAIDAALRESAASRDRPSIVLARTHKGRGVRAVEDRNGFHGKPLEDPDGAILELGGRPDVIVRPALPEGAGTPRRFPASGGQSPRWEPKSLVATRRAYGEALRALARHDGRVIGLDGEVGNSTYGGLLADAFPERHLETYVAENQMVAAAIGLGVRGWVPFASTFAAFWSRAYDFIRMAAVSEADLRLVGSHAGVSVGEDGPSQMALEDLAALRAVHGSTVLYPSCANQVPSLLEQMARARGVSYLRCTRMDTPVLYPPGTPFPIGGSRTLRRTDHDDVTIVAAGVTVHEALAAADHLAKRGVTARVIDAYSIKPIDADALHLAAMETSGIVVAEDHYPEGGLGDAVRAAFFDGRPRPRIRHLAVRELPMSGRPRELLAWAGIDAAVIAAAAAHLA